MRGKQVLPGDHVCDAMRALRNTDEDMFGPRFELCRKSGGWAMYSTLDPFYSDPVFFCPYCGERLDGAARQ